jgi:hypothetical protein
MEVCVSFLTFSFLIVFWVFIIEQCKFFLSGTTTLHNELEEIVANFVRKPAAIVFGMGHATNCTTLPVLIGKVCASS